jgi:hypothetical protein
VALTVLTAAAGCDDSHLGHLQPRLSASAGALDFPPTYLGATSTRTLTLVASGTAPVRILGLRFGSGAPFHGLGWPTVPVDIAVTGALSLAVAFRPTAAGTSTDSLLVTDSSLDAPALRIPVRGLGLSTPDCDDQNPCTDDAFDRATATCVHLDNAAPCDDGSLCTEHDRCAGGVCVGAPLDCDDRQACTRDLCDPVRGCVHLPDDGACDDGDPCTTDRCDASGAGCRHDALPLGSPCGAVSCAEAHLCLLGGCASVAPPDGTTCDDGDPCTAGDACSGGLCQGTAFSTPARLLAELPTFGAAGSAATVLSDGRLLFAEIGAQPWPPGEAPGLAPGLTRRMNVVERRAGELALAYSTTVSLGSVVSLSALSASVAVALVRTSSGVGVRVFRVAANGSVQLAGTTTVGLPEGVLHAGAPFGSTLYVCGDRSVTILDLSDPDHPAAVGAEDVPCDRLAVDRASASLLVASAARSRLYRYDLSAPGAPIATASVALDLLEPGLSADLGHAVVSTLEGVIEVLDAVRLEPLASFPTERRVPCLDLQGSNLLAAVVHVGELEIDGWDLARAPAPPVIVAALDGWDEGPLLALPSLASTPGAPYSVLTDGLGVWSSRVFARSSTGAGAVALTGPRHGTVRTLVPHPSDPALHALSFDAVREIDPGMPEIVSGTVFAGAPFPRIDGRVLPQSAGPAPIGGPVDPNLALSWRVPSMMGAQAWDLSDAGRPFAESVWGFDPNFVVRRESVSDGARAYAVSWYQSNGSFFEVYELGQAAAGVWLTPIGAASIPWFESTASDLALDAPAGRCAVSFAGLAQSAIFVFDVRTSTAPVVAAAGYLPYGVRSLVLSGDVLAVLRPEADADAGQPVELALGQWSAGRGFAASFETRRVAVPGARQILQFDGRTAVVSESAGLVFVDCSAPGAPRVFSRLPMSEDALTAARAGDRLVVGAHSAVSVLAPACP